MGCLEGFMKKVGFRHAKNIEKRTRKAIFSSIFAVVLIGILTFVFAMPREAYGTFADYSDGAGNVTDFERFEQQAAIATGVMGSTINASDIPDGTYTLPVGDSVTFSNGSVNVITSSTMCYVKSCTLNVSGDTITVNFSLSEAYNYLYMGSAEEAASKTNADGTDASNYIAGNREGDEYFYTITIPSLNSTIELSTYSGGRGNESGRWWTRRMMFVSTDEINKAVEDAKQNPDPDPEPTPDTDSGTDSGTGSSDSGTDDNSQQISVSTRRSGSGTGSGSSTGSGRGTSSRSVNTSRSSNSTNSVKSSPSTKTGILIASVSKEGGSSADNTPAAQAVVKEESKGSVSVVALGITGASVALLAAGLAIQTIVFKHRLGNVLPFAKTSDKSQNN